MSVQDLVALCAGEGRLPGYFVARHPALGEAAAAGAGGARRGSKVGFGSGAGEDARRAGSVTVASPFPSLAAFEAAVNEAMVQGLPGVALSTPSAP